MIKDKKRVEEFANNVFNYYNGRINVFNYPATMEIEWAELWDRDTGGIYLDPNRIILHPNVIKRYYHDEYAFYYNILISIIHELHHVDQEIYCIKMMNDREYYDYIERSVETESYLWVANHQTEIEQNFGFRDVISYNQYDNVIKHFETGRMYKRRNYFTHCLIILKSILYTEQHELLDVFTAVFKNPISRIDIIFNNETTICLKDGLNCCPVAQLNSIFRYYIFDYLLRSVKTNYKIKDNNLIIKFDAIGRNIMCKFIKEC